MVQYSHEIIVVDDNSPDGTAHLVRQAAKNHHYIKIIVRETNPGLGLSIKTGIENSKGNIIVGMDADFNHDPKDLPALLEGLDQADLVVASRFIHTGGMEEWYRYWPTWLFNLGLRLLGFPIHDNASGYYAILKKNMLSLRLTNIYYGYGDYHLRLVYYAKKKGLTLLEVPTYYPKRKSGESKSSLLKMAIAYTKEAWRLRYSTYEP